MTTSVPNEQQRIIDASLATPFHFEQGASLHVGILGMVGRPTGEHDEAPFVRGRWADGRSVGELDLTELQAPDEDATDITLWFAADRIALDISAAFQGVPAQAMQGSGIPPAVLNGPVMVERSGDAGDGVVAMVTQMCAGKIVLDPRSLLDVLASDRLDSFQEHHVENAAPLRAFNAAMSIRDFLEIVGLTRTTLVNQIAVLGYDLRRELGQGAIDDLDEHVATSQVQLAWLVDEHGRINTAQVVVALSEFIYALFSNEDVIAQLANEEGVSVEEMTAFVAQAAEAGRLVYVNAIWQKFTFVDAATAKTPDAVAVEPVVWPEAVDLSADVAAQASRLRSGTDHQHDHLGNVTVDPSMIDAMAASSGAMHFVLSDVQGDAVAAMQAARAAVLAVEHPDEPGEPLASFASDVVEHVEGAQFWVDISDMEEERDILEHVLASAVHALRHVVTSAHLGPDQDR